MVFYILLLYKSFHMDFLEVVTDKKSLLVAKLNCTYYP